MHHVVAVLFSKYTMMDGNIQYLPERSRTGPARRYVSKQPMLELTLATAPADHYSRAVRLPGARHGLVVGCSRFSASCFTAALSRA